MLIPTMLANYIVIDNKSSTCAIQKGGIQLKGKEVTRFSRTGASSTFDATSTTITNTTIISHYTISAILFVQYYITTIIVHSRYDNISTSTILC